MRSAYTLPMATLAAPFPIAARADDAPDAVSRDLAFAPRWRTLFAIWLVPTLLGAAISYTFTRLAGAPIGAWRALAVSVPTWYFWALLTPVIFRLGRRVPIAPFTAHALLVHLVASVTATLADVAAGATVALAVGAAAGAYGARYYLFGFLSWLPTGVLTYWAIVGAGHALDSDRRLRRQQLRASELRTQLARAELAALRAQLQPHFLFNTLNTAVSLVQAEEAATAVRVLTNLSDILRRVLAHAPTQEITLREELEFVQAYLAIERTRFPDRLHVRMEIADGALDALVPTMLLQPLVENAVKYGVARTRGVGQIEITATLERDRLQLRVRDDGPGLPAAWPPATGSGVGLVNAQARLQQLYGDAHEFILGNAAGGGAEVSIAIPLHTAIAAGGEGDHRA